MTLDPLAGEIVRNGEDEVALRDRGGVDLGEPGGEGVLVERLPEPTRNLVPDPFCSQLDWLFHPAGTLLYSTEKNGEHTNARAGTQRLIWKVRNERKSGN